jgi:hypothetical protein
MERVIIAGDLAKLSPEERVTYYFRVCESIGLNPLTKPFDYITLNGKLTLYPNKDCAAQLRKLQSVSITDLGKELIGDIYTVTIFGRAGGRDDVATGAVNIRGLGGENLANAYMKAETKAKRRLSLSLAGLGFADESELEDTPADPLPPVKLTLAERVAAKAAAIAGDPDVNSGPGSDQAVGPKVEWPAEEVAGSVAEIRSATPAESLARTPEEAAAAVAARRAARAEAAAPPEWTRERLHDAATTQAVGKRVTAAFEVVAAGRPAAELGPDDWRAVAIEAGLEVP